MANYIGKIAAVGTINMSQIASGLNASARDVEKYARTVRSTIVSANSAAGRSFQEIFTPLQRLERALQAANTRTLDIKVGGSAERIRAIVGAANDIARPLAASQKQFTALSATIQNEFIGSLTRAQNAAQLAESAINRGQIKNAAGYERLKRVVDEARSSISRLGEAGSAVSGLATGRELRFQQAGFAAELQRTSALQSQASALPADARASGAVAQLVELQRREAEEAARLLAVLENVRNTRRGDAAAAQANLDAQTQRLSQVNAQLERQVSLSNEAVRLAGERATREREIEQNIGAATQLRSTADATGRSIQQRVRDIAALREEEARRATAARDAAEADEIAAASARLRAQAASQLLGVLQQESQLISNQGAASTADATGRSIQQRVRDIAALREEEARRATAARDAAEADEIAAASARLRAQAASQLLGVLQQESQLLSNQGAASTTDPTGRSIQQRARDIARLNAATQAAAVRGLASRSEQRAGSDFASLGDAERGAADLFRRIETLGPQAFRQLSGEIEGLATAFATGFVGPVNVDFQRLLQSVQQLEGRAARLREASRLLVISDSEQSLINNQGAASTTDATGRSIQQRVRDIAALREEEARRATAARDAAEADEIAAASARLRAQAASQLLGVLQQESQLISNQGAASTTDATGRSIQQRVRDIAALREEDARRATAARDAAEADEIAAASARLRAQAASQLLGVLQQESQLISNQGAASTTDATGRSIQQRSQDIAALRTFERRREAENQLGLNVTGQQRGLDGLRAAVASVADQAERLPAAVRGRFIPALRDAQQEYVRLFSSGTATADQIDRAAARVRNLETQIGRASRAAQQFGGTFREFADASDSRAAAGGLEFLRQTLLRATGDTRAAEDAVDRYSAALQRAAAVPGGFRQFAGDLSRIRQQAVAAVAATEGVGLSARRINEGIRRTGDVARGSFGNTGLAIQQAAFIVDDFFSVTGGIEQRIRAIGNNISQLGFIVGGTYGLIVGVAVSAGAQAASALIKWANAGRSTENQTRALNEILQRQKTVVEELASAFNSLGQQIVSRGFSPAAAAANELADRIKEIVRLQREAAESSLTATSQGVADRRADQDVIRQRLESETNVGRRAALQRQLVEAQQAERDTARRFASGRATPLRVPLNVFEESSSSGTLASLRVGDAIPSGRQIASLFERIAQEALRGVSRRDLLSFRGFGRQGAVDALTGSTAAEFTNSAGQLRQFAENLDLGTSAEAITAQAAAIQQAVELFKGAASRTFLGFNTSASNEASEFIRALTEVRARILDGFSRGIDRDITSLSAEADRAGRAFADAQRAAQEAVERGVVGSEAFASGVDAASESIKRSIAAINEVVAGVDSDGRQVERTPEQIRAIVSREQANIGRLQAQAQASDQQTLQARLGRVIGGERATAALQSLQGAESFANEYAGLTAQLQRAVEVERIARERVARSSDAQSLAALAAARAASDLAASAAESALAIDSEFAGLRRGLDEALQSSRQQLDEAQQRVNDASAFGARPSDSVLRRRDAAEANFLADRSRISQLQSRLSEARSAALESPEIQDINRRLEAIRTRREQASERARVSGATEDVSEANRLAEEQVRLENERVLVLQRLTSATRQATEAETASSRLAAQGRELIATPGQRAGEELVRQLQAVRAAFEQSARLAGQPVDIARRQQAENRLFQDQVAQIAPIRVEFAREIQNAILAGPSRAPLQASDASSVEGRRELDRLLRRDDPAASANFAELQRVNANLRDLIQATRENAAPVAE